MKSDASEYKAVVDKLLEKTRARKVQWELPPFGSISHSLVDSFQCNLGSEHGDSYIFKIELDRNDSTYSLTMEDQSNHEIFAVKSNDLPTSRDEEQLLNMLQELYELARKQALHVEDKLGNVLTLLDRV